MTHKITLICGSPRPQSYTRSVVDFIAGQFDAIDGVETAILDMHELTIPFAGTEGDFPDVAKVQETIRGADAVVLATPEYTGSFASSLKLLMENLGYPSAIKAKPTALVGVASGDIGAIKSLEHLRSVASHAGAYVMPRVHSIGTIEKVFNNDGTTDHQQTAKRLSTLPAELLAFAGLV